MAESDAVSQILQAEHAWSLAQINCNVAALDDLMAEEYAQIDSAGDVVRKAQVIASLESGARHWDDARSDEIQVRVYGDAAVVVGRWRARGVNAGQAFDYAARYVSVWVW